MESEDPKLVCCMQGRYNGPSANLDYGEEVHYSLPSINVNPREWIKVNIYRGVNS